MFAADMKRMFANARTYNSPDTIYFKCANRFVSIIRVMLYNNVCLFSFSKSKELFRLDFENFRLEVFFGSKLHAGIQTVTR